MVHLMLSTAINRNAGNVKQKKMTPSHSRFYIWVTIPPVRYIVIKTLDNTRNEAWVRDLACQSSINLYEEIWHQTLCATSDPQLIK